MDTVIPPRTLIPRDTQRLEDIKKRIEEGTGLEFETTEQAVTRLLGELQRTMPAMNIINALRDIIRG